jgi:SPP1 gp7 family putative phage head morphogenesis protein
MSAVENDDWDTDASATELAAKWFKDKAPVTEQEYWALEEHARARAFTVSGVAELDLISTVYESIERAVRDGTTLEDFRKDVGGLLESEWGGANPARLETIFRTNVQASYSAGRYIQNNRPEVRATHPYSKFSAILDGHETDICHDLNGTVLRSDDPFWASHQPPLHFNCRSDVTAISEADAAELGGPDEAAPDTEAAEGFGGVLEPYEPDLSTRPTDLVSIYEMKQHL